MPALITHRLFGEESIDRLPEGLVSSEEERRAFLIANQGPDPFFFHVRSTQPRICLEFGQVMHRSRMTRQFQALRDGVEHLQQRDARIGRAFALGMLSHYVLDRTAHPFVYAQQWGIQRVDATLAHAGGQVHAVIETDLDILMLQRKHDGATVAAYPSARVLETSPQVNVVAGALTSFVARSVYGLAVLPSEYGGAVADMTLGYRLIEPAGSPRSRLLAAAEGLVRGYSLLGALAHPITTEVPRGAGNLDHHPWENPFTRESSNESFPEVFERALDAYAVAAERFISSDDLAEMTGHLNYSGRPLDATEECTEDDEPPVA